MRIKPIFIHILSLYLILLPVIHGKKREVPVSRARDLDTSCRDDMGMAPPSDHGGGASSTGKSREVKVQDIPTVLTFMRSKFSLFLIKITNNNCSFLLESEQDPFELLRLCHHDGIAVRVWIRHCVGVRGVCEGVPVAFDRHMNLVLRDVVERYVPFRTSANGGVTESDSKRKRIKRKKKKKEQSEENIDDKSRTEQSLTGHVTSLGSHVIPSGSITRHLNQLFIRGDNIILVNRLLPESSPQIE